MTFAAYTVHLIMLKFWDYQWLKESNSPGSFLISFLIGVFIVLPSLVLLRIACFQSSC